jgi:predicted ribosome quality control (RQC) complex YloA/Tae2 family protein
LFVLKKPIQAEYWSYTLADGWQAYAGKSAMDNDLLSLEFAQPEDFWFHVHDQPGSHVILRAPENSQTPPDRALLEQAAAIAAWHSKARGCSRCTVDCTQARHVSKSRAAPPGTVTITHVRRLKVKPALPPGSED